MFGVNADHAGNIQNLIQSVIFVRGILAGYGNVPSADGSMSIHLLSVTSVVDSRYNTHATDISSMGTDAIPVCWMGVSRVKIK